jgi:hypothetical protein
MEEAGGLHPDRPSDWRHRMIPHASGAGNRSALPNLTFWRSAAGECETIAACVLEGTLPEWCAPFEMARAVRGYPASSNHKPLKVAVEVYRACEIVRQLYPAEEDFVNLFANAWDKVRVLPGTDLIGSAVKMADATPLDLFEKHRDDVTGGYKRFISFCAYLCVGVGSDLIKIPCREVGAALGVRKDTVSCYRQQAVHQGYLVLIKPHTYKAGGKGEATLFRFRADWWPLLKDKVKSSAA